MITSQSSAAAASPSSDPRPHAVVIGSGFGGLAAAVRLGARGYRVTVLEKLPEIGGRARVFRQDGHVFDAGPTIVTAPYLFEELWTLCGRKMADDVTLVPLDPFYTVRFADGETFRCNGDAEGMRAEVARLSPDDVAGYERFLKESEEIFKVGFQGLSSIPFDSPLDMLKVLPDFIRLRSDRSVFAHVAKHIKNPYLRMALSFHPLFVGGNPFQVTSIYSLIAYLERHWGVHWAMGGTGKLASGLAGLIEGQGGVVRCNTEVAALTLDGRRATGVRLASGEEIKADIVVSNADSAYTYHKLLPSGYPRSLMNNRLDDARQSMSLFVWYVGTRGTQGLWRDVGHHTILMGPRYKELLDDIFHKRILADDFSLYIHRPTVTDPSLAPAGGDSFYILSPVPNTKGSTEWPQAAEAYRDRIADALEATLLPGLRRQMTVSRMITPAYFRDALLSWDGAAFGPEPLFRQSAWFRPHNRSEDVDGLYLVGAGTHPGAGLPGVLSSARILDKVVPDARVVA
ncbi:phytoene desaturase [Pararhodospirillum oryzae]|uniref:Phytoene dehydrogenase n=2 Tax=Pararhodospirillum oryzae TaxID=478448 RepID=A0A512H883_9PROT|nr:phytoene desaturase [Pararhodospirillum oryzae]